MSKTVNELHAELRTARMSLSFTKRMRWLALFVGLAFFSGIPGGTALSIWSTFHHIDLGGSIAGMVLMGIFLGLPLLAAAVFLTVEAAEERERIVLAEAKYHDAIQEQMGQKA